MRLYYSQNLFTSCIGAVSDVFTGVGTRFYHSEKVFHALQVGGVGPREKSLRKSEVF